MNKNRFFAVLLFACIVTALSAAIYMASPPAERGISEGSSVRPHLVVSNQLYWLSAFPSDRIPSHLICIGEVKEEVQSEPTRDWQAYRISAGTKVYSDAENLHVVYLDVSNSLCRYATTEASKSLLYYDKNVYVSLSSLCSWDYGNYVSNYEPLYGKEMVAEHLPEDAVYVGNTKFIGYNMLVHGEFESNTFQDPVPIYQDRRDPDRLYVGDGNVIYVKER